MEERPLFPPSSEDDEDKPKKDSSVFESKAEPEEETREKASQTIARFLSERSDEDEPEPEAESKVETEPATHEFTAEEEVYVNQAIAEEHLEHPVTNEPPEPPVEDFLGQVKEGEEPQTAFESTLEDSHLEAQDQAEAEAPIESESEAETKAEDQAEEPVDPRVAAATGSTAGATHTPTIGTTGQHSSNQPPIPPRTHLPPPPPPPPSSPPPQPTHTYGGGNYPPVSPAVAPGTVSANANRPHEVARGSAVLPAFIAGEVVGHILGKRAGEKKTQKKLVTQQKKLVKKVNEMAQDLTAQELTLQELSREKRVKDRVTAPVERTQPGLRESRLNMTKPEQAERLGKVVVAALPETKPVKPKPPVKTERVRPEQVKTMSRKELLELSDTVQVDGASLRRMYENNLFGEGALRRLLSEHLEGKDIKPQLKSEILERQLDFERDPLLRDSRNLDIDVSPPLFDRMLKGVNKTLTKPVKTKPEIEAEAPKSKPKLSLKPKALTGTVAGNVVLALIIAALAGLIIYLLTSR